MKEPFDFEGFFSARIVVVGANGSGKTWFANRLSEHLNVPVFGKDRMALTTGWVQRPKVDVQAAILQKIMTTDAWVFEGGPSILTPAVLARANHVIWLDMPGWLRFARVIVRSVRYLGRTRPEHPPGNRDWPGLRQCRFAWRVLMGGDRFAQAITVALDEAAVPVVRLRSRAEVVGFLGGLGGVSHHR